MDPHEWLRYASRHGHDLRISASDAAVVIVADDPDALRWARRSRRLIAGEWHARVVTTEQYEQSYAQEAV